MVIKRRIETEEAKELRSKRRDFAMPGGAHDRLVHFLARALPMAVGIVAALMVITPLSPRGEVSFLLDRNKVAMIDERLSVENAMYRGQDNLGRPFSLTAGEAVQKSSREGVVRMSDLVARIVLSDGPARISASEGAYDIDKEVMSVIGPLQLSATDGYSLVANDVSVNLSTKRVVGSNGVKGSVPAGSFSADRLEADLDARTVTLIGNAHLVMRPGELRMPK